MYSDYSLEHKERQVKWEPSRSTPSCKVQLKELPDIVSKLRDFNSEKVVDLGSGNGRNSKLLKSHFNLTLVECGRNVTLLEADSSFENCKIYSFEKFSVNHKIRYDAILISYVLHTIPDIKLRNTVLKLSRNYLNPQGVLCIVSPKTDSKYTTNKLSMYTKHNDGIYKVYPDNKFTFYENITQSKLIDLAKQCDFKLIDKIVSKSKNILFFK